MRAHRAYWLAAGEDPGPGRGVYNQRLRDERSNRDEKTEDRV